MEKNANKKIKQRFLPTGERMSLIGKSVSHVFADIFRFGTVIEEKTDNTWKYVKINWFDDESFEMDRLRVINLRGYDKYSDWYRIDKVNFIDVEKMISTLNKLKTSTKRKKALTQHQQRTYFSRKVPAC
jgi:hypothetical protein